MYRFIFNNPEHFAAQMAQNSNLVRSLQYPLNHSAIIVISIISI